MRGALLSSAPFLNTNGHFSGTFLGLLDLATKCCSAHSDASTVFGYVDPFEHFAEIRLAKWHIIASQSLTDEVCKRDQFCG